MLEATNFERPLPALWKQFDALASVPVMVIRGGNSDILSITTVAAMRARRSSLEVVEIPDQGHAPILAGTEIIGGIARFVGTCEATPH